MRASGNWKTRIRMRTRDREEPNIIDGTRRMPNASSTPSQTSKFEDLSQEPFGQQISPYHKSMLHMCYVSLKTIVDLRKRLKATRSDTLLWSEAEYSAQRSLHDRVSG